VEELKRDAITRDTLFGGKVALTQPARATSRYRVNVDALLLAAFAARVLAGASATAKRRTARAAFDLGAGVGAVGLSLLHLGGAAHVTMVESDAVLARLARANAAANGYAERVTVAAADVADESIAPLGAADLVVCNPPYVPPGRGRVPLAPRAAARVGSLAAFVDAARRLAGRRARVCFVYPVIEATTLLLELRRRGLEPKRLRIVHGRADGAARIVLVEALAGRAGGLVVEPPLVETDARGKRTAEMTSLLDPS